MHQVFGLSLQAFCGSGALLHQSGVLLRGLIHLCNRLAHLPHTLALLLARSRDLTNQVRDMANSSHHLIHGGTCLRHQMPPLRNALHALTNQLLDLFGRFCTAPRQCTHFAGNDGKATALLTGTCGFHSGIQSQDVGLESNAVDHANDVGNFFAAGIYVFHGGNHLPHPAPPLAKH